MTLSNGYLTSKQLKIWDLKRRGSIESKIARELRITRQTVHKAANVAENRVSQALMETAKLNKIKVRNVDAAIGILSGFSSEFKTPVIITFSAENGVQVWYKHEGKCENCERLDDCRRMLLKEMEERHIQPSENLESNSPSKIAELLFREITGE